MAQTGTIAVIKAKLGDDGYKLLRDCSLQYQKGEVTAEEYYDLAMDMLQGDTLLLMELVAKLPNPAKRQAVQTVHDSRSGGVKDGSEDDEVVLAHQLAQTCFHTATQQQAPPSAAAVSQQTLVISGGGDLSGNLLWTNADGVSLGEVLLEAASSQHVQAHSTSTTLTPTSTPWIGTGKHKYGHKRRCADLPMHALPAHSPEMTQKPAPAHHPVGNQVGGSRQHQERQARADPHQRRPRLGPESVQQIVHWPGRVYYHNKPSSGQHAASRTSDIHVPLDCAWQHSREPSWLPAERAAHPEAFPSIQCEQTPVDPWQAPDFRGDDLESSLTATEASPSPKGHAAQPSMKVQVSSAQLAKRTASGHGGKQAEGKKKELVGPCRGVAASKSQAPIIVWFRRDLRLADNQALLYAASTGRPVLPVFVWAPQEMGQWPVGAASKYWLHHALGHLSLHMQAVFRTPLVLFDARRSSSLAVLQSIALQTGATEVAFNRVYEPWLIKRDEDVLHGLASRMGMTWRSFNALLCAAEPWDAAPDDTDWAAWNSGYGSVRFFLNGCKKVGEPAEPDMALPTGLQTYPPKLHPPSSSLAGLQLAGLPALPRQRAVEEGTEWRARAPIDWAAGIREAWRFDEEGGQQALREFLEEGIHHFETRSQAKSIQSIGRWEDDGVTAGLVKSGDAPQNRPPAAPLERFRADKRWTARISPYMAWGQLSPRQVYHAALKRHGRKYTATFLRRLAWRDLAYWALWRFPWLPDRPLRPQYEHQRWDLYWHPTDMRSLDVIKQRWDPDDPRLRAWQRGETGFPLVDAAMRELWLTGYMPNYLRHVAAGFLVEYLNIDWRHGQLWFHDTLVDADVAINAFMWQNGGHSGTDQWNFVMHPVFAAKAADPDGDYVRRWVPELSRLPLQYIHQPWDAPITVLAAAGVRLGRTYPKRIIQDLERCRANSLASVVEMRRGVGRSFVLPDGNEALPLPDGRFARAITRIDYREEAEEPVTKQAAADMWHKSRRPLRDAMSAALHEPLTNGMSARNEPGGWSRAAGKLG